MIFNIVKKIIMTNLGLSESVITDDLDLKRDIELMDFAEIICSIEDELNIELSDDDMTEITNLKELCEYIELTMN